MNEIKDLDRRAFLLIFFALSLILAYLACLWEVAKTNEPLSPLQLQNLHFATERAMMALMLTALGGLGLDLLMRKYDKDIKN